MPTKLAHQLAVGDRVRMEDDTIKVVARTGPGFVRYGTADESTVGVGSIFIDWRDGDWSQVARDQICELVK